MLWWWHSTLPQDQLNPLYCPAIIEEIKALVKQIFLQLNSSKTEAIQVSTPYQFGTFIITSIIISGQNIPLSTSTTNLGVRMDSYLTFEAHIKHLRKTSFFQTFSCKCGKDCHAFVSSRLNSSGSRAKAPKSSSTSRTVLLGSWWGCTNTNILPPSSNHSTCILSHSVQCLPPHTPVHPFIHIYLINKYRNIHLIN